MMDKVKIEQAKIRKKEEIIERLNPLVKEWFFSRFNEFSLPQLYGVMPIYERRNILISAPTGGTKTLTAFLSILNYLVELACKNELEEKVYCVYISPLKALSNDIFVNLINPLKEIEEIADKKKIKMQKIRVNLRTGDTTASEKQKQTNKAPHILVTTPESLAIVLTSFKFVENMRGVEFVIIDEIHAMANKRGVYMSLSLERLEEVSKITPVRIGLSATIAPLEEIAMFLIGIGDERTCLIANIDFNKEIDIKIDTPVEDLIESEAYDIHFKLYKKMHDLIQEHKTTLIFTNTRSATERVVNNLKEMFPKDYIENIGAHHSSLSKEHRFSIEERLRKGELKVVVCSTSLELGIDIGYVDLVLLLGSPKSTARALQRIGRAGHQLHATPKGRFVVLDRDDLVECSVMQKEMIERKIDKVQIPKNCLDVLSQQIYGMAIYKKWNIEELFKLIKRSYCYSTLSRQDFLDVISYLTGEYGLEDKNIYAKIWYDPISKEIGKKGKLARVIYLTNIGTIPEEGFINVVLAGKPQNSKNFGSRKSGDFLGNEKVGQIDEGFLEKLKKNDIFVLGGQKYQYEYTRGMNIYVRNVIGKNPTIPSWFSESLPLSFDLACDILKFRQLIKEKISMKFSPSEIKEFISEYVYCDGKTANSIYNYMYEQEKYIGIPDLKNLIVERYKGDKEYVIFHSLYGRRVNDAFSRAIGLVVGRLSNRDVSIGVNDNGFYLIGEKIDVERALKQINVKNVEEILKEAIERTDVLLRRFRHCAARSLMILRNYKGRKKSVGKQQMKSFFLMPVIRKISHEFPILKEARREVLEDLMDIENLKLVLSWIESGKIKIVYKETDLPSPFSLNLILQGHYDLIRIEDKMEFLKRMHKALMARIAND